MQSLLKKNEDDIISDINVTPLVDIMLVLLIIFMLVSTFVDFSIKVDLPHAATGEDIQSESISIMISKEGDYFLAGKYIASFDELKEKLQKKRDLNPEIQVIISADKKVYHEEIVRVIDTIRKINIFKFAINVEPLEEVIRQ